MKVTTAGESHGRALVAIIEDLPANLPIDIEEINYFLSLRAKGYGRGGRQKIEADSVQILSGVRNGFTMGSPITLLIENKDFANWSKVMDCKNADLQSKKLTRVRAGHADYAGAMKYNLQDVRNIVERASARETAIRVAAGSVARQFLKALSIEVCGYVRQVANVVDNGVYSFQDLQKSRQNELFMLDRVLCKQAKNVIDSAKECGDTVGGVIEVRVNNIKAGFGSCMTYAEKLDANLAREVMSVQAVKGVAFGDGFELGMQTGSKVHDVLYYENGKFRHKSNHCGGIEGGMTNGEEIVLRAVQKPLPTLMQPLDTVDIVKKESAKSAT